MGHDAPPPWIIIKIQYEVPKTYHIICKFSLNSSLICKFSYKYTYLAWGRGAWCPSYILQWTFYNYGWILKNSTPLCPTVLKSSYRSFVVRRQTPKYADGGAFFELRMLNQNMKESFDREFHKTKVVSLLILSRCYFL